MKITVNKGLCTECNYSDEEDQLDQVRNVSKIAAELHDAKKEYKGDYIYALTEAAIEQMVTDIKTYTAPKDLSFGKKPPLSLVPPTALVLISKAMEDGAKKRSVYNWRDSKISTMQLLDKVLRHVYKFLDGQDHDEETSLPELAHAAADLTVLIDAIETDSVVDDRPRKGKTAELIKKHTNE